MADSKNTKEGRLVALKYADILHLSRPEPPVKHPRMALSNRAKIFSPFAALRGFDDEISSEGASKLLVKKVELSDEEKNNLSDKLLQVKKGMKVVVRYFMKAAESTGKYISLTGTVVMIDPVYRELKVMQDSDRKAVGIEKELPVIIPFDDIADLAGEGITNIEDFYKKADCIAPIPLYHSFVFYSIGTPFTSPLIEIHVFFKNINILKS